MLLHFLFRSSEQHLLFDWVPCVYNNSDLLTVNFKKDHHKLYIVFLPSDLDSSIFHPSIKLSSSHSIILRFGSVFFSVYSIRPTTRCWEVLKPDWGNFGPLNQFIFLPLGVDRVVNMKVSIFTKVKFLICTLFIVQLDRMTVRSVFTHTRQNIWHGRKGKIVMRQKKVRQEQKEDLKVNWGGNLKSKSTVHVLGNVGRSV